MLQTGRADTFGAIGLMLAALVGVDLMGVPARFLLAWRTLFGLLPGPALRSVAGGGLLLWWGARG